MFFSSIKGTHRIKIRKQYAISKHRVIDLQTPHVPTAAKKHIATQATRAMFCLLKKARPLLLPIDMQIEMFEKTVKPILLYGCEVIGTGNINILEQAQLKKLNIF